MLSKNRVLDVILNGSEKDKACLHQARIKDKEGKSKKVKVKSIDMIRYILDVELGRLLMLPIFSGFKV